MRHDADVSVQSHPPEMSDTGWVWATLLEPERGGTVAVCDRPGAIRQDIRQRSFSTGCGARPPKTRDEIVKAPLEWSLAGGVKRANAKAGNQR
jgi:hypothetical protein